MASTTTNLKLTKIDSNDYISPDPINDAFDIIDGLGKVYMTDAGESDGWYYIKFSNGFAFCACTVSGTTKENTTSYNLKKNYPFSFASDPVVTGAAGAAGVVSSGVRHIGKSSTMVDIWMDTSTSDAGRSYWFYVKAFGKVKA